MGKSFHPLNRNYHRQAIRIGRYWCAVRSWIPWESGGGLELEITTLSLTPVTKMLSLDLSALVRLLGAAFFGKGTASSSGKKKAEKTSVTRKSSNISTTSHYVETRPSSRGTGSSSSRGAGSRPSSRGAGSRPSSRGAGSSRGTGSRPSSRGAGSRPSSRSAGSSRYRLTSLSVVLASSSPPCRGLVHLRRAGSRPSSAVQTSFLPQ